MLALSLWINHLPAPATRGRWESHRDDTEVYSILGEHSCYHDSPEKLTLRDPDLIFQTLLPSDRQRLHGPPSPAQPARSPRFPGASSFPGIQLKQALSVGPNSALSKDPCVSLKRGIDRDIVRAAQPMAGWLGLARPRNFPKPSYFLFLGPARPGPPGHRAQSPYTSRPVPWLAARRAGVGGGCHCTGSPGHTANAPGILL